MKTVLTRCHILQVISIKFNLGSGCAKGPTHGAHSTPQTAILIAVCYMLGREAE